MGGATFWKVLSGHSFLLFIAKEYLTADCSTLPPFIVLSDELGIKHSAMSWNRTLVIGTKACDL